MRRRPLVLFGFALLLTLSALTPWAIDAAAPAPSADFAPPMSRWAARARVAAAQATQQARLDAAPQARAVYFEATGHHLGNRVGFLDFWRANGQVLLFGYPVTEEIIEQGRMVQYFERARFEYHPEFADTPFEVQLGLLGAEQAQHDGLLAGQAIPDPQNGMPYFAETGHSVLADFAGFWAKRGGLALFGFPLSEPYEVDGRLVQYFERARFEYFPEELGSFYRSAEQWNGLNLATLHEVGLADLGRQAAVAAGHPLDAVAPRAGVEPWSPALWARGIEVNLSTQELVAYEGKLAVYRAPVATGRDGFNTPAGDYAVYAKVPLQTMSGSIGGESWSVPNIPAIMYINGGVALHGTYWHDAFGSGVRLSHGCINLGMDDAQWLYEWADVGVPVRVFY